jgi:hypothetical protein
VQTRRHNNWQSRARRAKGAAALALFTFLSAALPSLCGCESKDGNLSQRGTDVRIPSESGEFDLVAAKVDADLGAIKPEESASAVFPIKNYGTVPVHLELGNPSCACTRIDLDKPTLQPGETASIRMDVANHGKLGPFQATVTVSATSQRWSEILTVHAFGMGFYVFSRTVRLPPATIDKPLRLAGRLYTRAASTPFVASVELVQPRAGRPEGPLKIAPPVVSDPRPSDHYFERDVQITIPPFSKLASHPHDPQETLVLSVSVSLEGTKQGQTIYVKPAS